MQQGRESVYGEEEEEKLIWERVYIERRARLWRVSPERELRPRRYSSLEWTPGGIYRCIKSLVSR